MIKSVYQIKDGNVVTSLTIKYTAPFITESLENYQVGQIKRSQYRFLSL